jgi:hypothetical protein
MSIDTLPTSEAFRTEPLLGLPTAAKVDRKAMTITGAKAMQIGPLNSGDSRPWKVDATSLDQLEALANASGRGAKMRFAHPNMSSDGMGRHLGRATNARRVSDPAGDYTAVDLKLIDAAKRGPKGDLASHVMDLAEQAPEDFGLSIAPLLDRAAMDKMEPDANGLRAIRIKELRAIDVVDEPAATRGGLFSLESDSLADLPAQATDLLDTFFSESSADVIRARFGAFLNTYLRNRGDTDVTTTEQAPAIIPAAQPAPVVVPVATLSIEAEAARAELAKAAKRGEIEALCKLAKLDDATKDLFLKAGFSRAEAQAWIKDSGTLSAQNPPLGEGSNDPSGEQKKTPADAFGAEYDAQAATFAAMNISREQYVASRIKG